MTEKRGRGRPRKYAEGSMANVTFRMTKVTRDRLYESAVLNGRSIREEIEGRIQRSFDAVDIVEEVRSLLRAAE